MSWEELGKTQVKIDPSQNDVQLSGSNPYERYEVIATVAPDSQVLTTPKKYITVINMSNLHPAMVSYDAIGNGIDNEIRLEPGAQHSFIRDSITTVNFYAVVATARLEIIASDMSPTSILPSINRNHNLRIDRYSGQKLIKAIKNGIYYGTQGDMNLYKSLDKGKTWVVVKNFFAEGEQPRDVFITKNNTIIMSTAQKTYWRGLNGGAGAWTKILTDVENYLSSSGIDQSLNTGTICFAEYVSDSGTEGGQNSRLFRSTDDGATWTAVVTYTAPSTIRHIHTVRCDPTDGFTWYYSTGDRDNQTLVGKSTDDGATFTDFVPAFTTATFPYGPQQSYRNLGYLFTDDSIIWATDSPNQLTRIYKAPKTDMTKKVQKASFEGPVYGMIRLDHLMLAYTKAETAYSGTKYAKVYGSIDDGETWKLIVNWPINDVAVAGFTKLVKSDGINDNCVYVMTDLQLLGTGAPNYYATGVKISLD